MNAPFNRNTRSTSAASRLRAKLCITLALCCALPSTAFSQTGGNGVSGSVADGARMPSIKAEDLNERVVTLPADLPAERTLVLMAFQREQQADVNTWIEALDLASGKLPWIELPVVGAGGAIWQGFVNAGMRTGIRTEQARERVVTLFTDRKALLRTMGLPGEGSVILALVMNRSGEVLAQVQGRHSAEKAQGLLEAMQAK